MRTKKLISAVSAMALALLASGCVTIAPLASEGPGTSVGADKTAGASIVATSVPESPDGPRRTRKPRPQQTTAPTAEPTAAPTETTSATDSTLPPTDPPTDPPTEPPTSEPTPQPTLNYSLPAVYGSTALTSGFVPDPFSVGMTGGGPVNTNYLGGGCYGYTSTAPSFSVNYTSGALPLLRLYFIGSGDTTLIVNAPSGSYFCVDDSFGTLHPTIDFNSPASGRYDIWVATYAQGATIGGTLYVTENSSNYPE
jgi:hypothetical protein